MTFLPQTTPRWQGVPSSKGLKSQSLVQAAESACPWAQGSWSQRVTARSFPLLSGAANGNLRAMKPASGRPLRLAFQKLTDVAETVQIVYATFFPASVTALSPTMAGGLG